MFPTAWRKFSGLPVRCIGMEFPGAQSRAGEIYLHRTSSKQVQNPFIPEINHCNTFTRCKKNSAL